MLRMKALPDATVREMLSWPHGGFSLDGGTLVEASDRAGLGHLLLYVLRPGKGKTDSLTVLEWTGAEFVGRMATLIPRAQSSRQILRRVGVELAPARAGEPSRAAGSGRP